MLDIEIAELRRIFGRSEDVNAELKENCVRHGYKAGRASRRGLQNFCPQISAFPGPVPKKIMLVILTEYATIR